MNSKLFHQVFAVLAGCSRALKMQQPLSWKGIFAFRWSANIAVHSLHHYTKILFHKEAFSFLSFFPRPFKIGSHSCLRSWTREETTEKPTQLSPKQKYSKLGPGCDVSIVPPGRLAPSMNALIVRCPSFFLSSFAHSAHLAHAILLHLCTPLYLLVRHLPVPVRELYYARLGLGLGGERCPAETSIYPAHCRLRSPKSMGTAAYNGQSTKELLS